MAAEESVKPVGALTSRKNSTAQMLVLVGKNVNCDDSNDEDDSTSSEEEDDL